MSKDRPPIFDTRSEAERWRSTYGAAVAQARKKIDYEVLAAVLVEDPAGAPDMATIARRLGVAKPTLYRLAGTREHLIELSVDAEAERLLEAIHRDGVDGVFDFAAATPAGMKLLFASGFPSARAAQRRVESRLTEALRRAPTASGGPTGEDLAAAAAGVLGMAAAIACRAVARERHPDAERMRSDFDRASKLAQRISDSGAVHVGADGS